MDFYTWSTPLMNSSAKDFEQLYERCRLLCQFHTKDLFCSLFVTLSRLIIKVCTSCVAVTYVVLVIISIQ